MSQKWFKDVTIHNLDCGDNSCKYKSNGSGGMRTNCGCRCADNRGRDVERFMWRNYLKALQKIQELEATLEIEKILEKP
jgi:hypothetical protein